jgi:heme/copper-type cytochrome/quinol oxidase subunit 1
MECLLVSTTGSLKCFRMLNKNLGYVHFWVTAICAYGVFFPMHFIGLAFTKALLYKY